MTETQRVELLYKGKDKLLNQLVNKEEELDKVEMSVLVQLLKDNKVLDIRKDTPESELIDNLIESK